MNFMDLILLLIFVGLLALGFFQGMIRLAVLILAFYLSVVLASLYFPSVGDFIHTHFDSNGEIFAAQYIGFFIVLLISFGLLAAAGLYTFRYAHLPGKLQYLDRIIGVLLGIVLAALVIGILAVILWTLMIEKGGINIDLPLFRAIGNSVSSSFLLRYFADYILPQVYINVRPILPDGARVIFGS